MSTDESMHSAAAAAASSSSTAPAATASADDNEDDDPTVPAGGDTPSTSSGRESRLAFCGVSAPNVNDDPERLFQLQPSLTNIQPVSLNEVEREAQPLFVSFIRQRLRLDQPQLPPGVVLDADLLEEGQDNLTEVEEQIADKLVSLSRVLDSEHRYVYDTIIQYLNANPFNVADLYRGVADALLQGRKRNWGHVVTLFYLGYRMVIECVRLNIPNFLSKLVSSFLDVLRRLDILKWVADNGGWTTILYLVRDYVSTLPRLSTSLAVISSALLLVWLLGRFS